MDTPGREELRKAYAELADEILMDISQNVNREYEASAVEVAKAVLDERGVNLPDLKNNTPRLSNGSGAVITGPFLEIPRFSAEECAAIEDVFNDNSLTYERHEVAAASCGGCGCSEYVYHVPEESFGSAVEVLKEYYLTGTEEGESSRYSGTCPACGTELERVEECTDCGLTLAVDHAKSLENHPFIRFLKQNNLL